MSDTFDGSSALPRNSGRGRSGRPDSEETFEFLTLSTGAEQSVANPHRDPVRAKSEIGWFTERLKKSRLDDEPMKTKA